MLELCNAVIEAWKAKKEHLLEEGSEEFDLLKKFEGLWCEVFCYVLPSGNELPERFSVPSNQSIGTFGGL
jgi:hypothetical protein